MKSVNCLLSCLLVSAAAVSTYENGHVFNLSKTPLQDVKNTYYDNITQSSDVNFVYTVEIGMGTPA